MIDENETIKAKRRDCLVEELGDYGDIEVFDDLLSKLQLKDEYKAFKHRFRGIFAAMAFRAIAYLEKTAIQPNITDDVRSEIKTERTINPRGPIAHMFRVEYRGQSAILKLAWSPVNRLPELAVYDALKAANIPNIPSIIDSGIIIEKSFGYRVEYLLIEDCGVPLAEYLQTQMLLGISKQSDIAASAMFQAVECIYGAWKAGILHRDITADSVVVKGGQVCIIDWGHAKIVKDGPMDVDTLAATWLFDKDLATGNEGSSAPIIGNPLYTSIPVLAGAEKRSIADDVESVLYSRFERKVEIEQLERSEYDAFKHRFRGIFAAMAFRAIAYVDGTAIQPTIPDSTRTTVEAELTRDTTADDSVHAHLKCFDSFEGLECVGLEGEAALIKYFKFILRMARHAIAGLSSDERKMDVILKLAWSPVDQLPESAVYDALKAANIPKIPLIIDSGIIIEKSFGYRVEYLLIEDCGISLTKYLLTQSHWDMKRMSDNAARPMSQIVETIYNAWNAGILHRDISADNILVKGGQVRIIDWGSATLLENSSVDINAIEAKWLFKKKTGMYNEYKPESVGTSLYKSIPVLISATQRSIVDDIESALYVVLESVFKTRPDNLNVEPIALRLESEHSLAFVRGCCLSDVNYYRQAFGIPHCSERFAWLMDTFREYLFVRNGEYIGSKLAMQPLFERTVEIEQLERILEQIKERIYGESPVSNTGKKRLQDGKSNTCVKAPRRSKRLQPKKRRR
ncbi:hypothetical protein GGH96_005327 [Coemansia sp. RSA 1972]|nr:hypothetical protein GGH96_005327 [Coemansia sp. RSA 1972]